MIRTLTNEDYPKLVDWWNTHVFSKAPPQHILPATGYMANEIAAGFLYLTNSPISWLGFIVTDPGSDRGVRSDSLDELLTHIFEQAKLAQSSIMFAATPHDVLSERLARLGFVDGDKNVNNFVKPLL